MCLYAKDACNCAICAGLFWDDGNSEISIMATYYGADDWFSFANGDIDEPEGEDISEGWLGRNIDAEYDDDLTGAVGDQFNVWRF